VALRSTLNTEIIIHRAPLNLNILKYLSKSELAIPSDCGQYTSLFPHLHILLRSKLQMLFIKNTQE